MKNFLLKIKNGAKRVFFHDMAVGSMITGVIFVGVIILQEIDHDSEIMLLKKEAVTIMDDLGEQNLQYRQELYQRELIIHSQKDLINRASELIHKYQEAIKELINELNKRDGYDPSRSIA